MSGPLLKAALAAEEAIAAHHGDCWHGVALLYVGAVRQMDATAPTVGTQSEPLLPTLAEATSDRPLTGIEFQEVISRSIKIISAQKNSPSDLTEMALRLVLELGRPLYSRMAFLLSSSSDPHTTALPSLFMQSLDSREYLLMLSAFSNRQNLPGEGDSLGQELVQNLPANGWSAVPPKILLPYVRVFPIDPPATPKVWYLEKLHPPSNARLASLMATDGVSLAAIPMHRELRFSFDTITEVKGVRSIRIKTLTTDSKSWQAHLVETMKECARRKVTVAVLPELMGGQEVDEVLRNALVECKDGYPLIVVGASAHEDDGDDFYNRAHVHVATGGGRYEAVCHHDKFERFAEGNMSEGCKLGSGLTFLVTAVGVIAIGICKDWFFTRSAGSPRGHSQFNDAQPILAVAPALSSSVLEIKNLGGLFKETRTPLIFANACGPVSSQLRKGQCCAIQRDKEPKLYDARSFVACPKEWSILKDKNDSTVETGEQGVWITYAPCKYGDTNDNTVYARVLPKKTECPFVS